MSLHGQICERPHRLRGRQLVAGQGFNMAYTIQCEKATLDFDLSRGPEAMRIVEHGKAPLTIKLEAGDGYAHEINYIVDCVKNRKAPSVVTGTDGLTALEICEAEEKSILTGQVVKL